MIDFGTSKTLDKSLPPIKTGSPVFDENMFWREFEVFGRTKGLGIPDKDKLPQCPQGGLRKRSDEAEMCVYVPRIIKKLSSSKSRKQPKFVGVARKVTNALKTSRSRRRSKPVVDDESI